MSTAAIIWASLECKILPCSAKGGTAPLTAIWLDNPIAIETGLTKKIAVGDRVLVEDGKLKDCFDKPTHEISNCHWNSPSEFSITVIDLKTLELTKIKI